MSHSICCCNLQSLFFTLQPYTFLLSWCNCTTDLLSVFLPHSWLKSVVLVQHWLLSEALLCVTELPSSERLVERASTILLICFMIHGPFQPFRVIFSNLANTFVPTSFSRLYCHEYFPQRYVVSFAKLRLALSPWTRDLCASELNSCHCMTQAAHFKTSGKHYFTKKRPLIQEPGFVMPISWWCGLKLVVVLLHYITRVICLSDSQCHL